MAAHFKVYGPYKIPTVKGKNSRYIETGCADFWKLSGPDRLAGQCGCYVFAMRAGKGFTPIYVGKTQKSFKSECFATHKIADHFGPALCNAGKCTPVMFLVAVNHTKGKLSGRAIGRVEKFLIQNAVTKNPELSNVKGKKQERWIIEGVIRSGKGKSSAAAKKFKATVGL